MYTYCDGDDLVKLLYYHQHIRCMTDYAKNEQLVPRLTKRVKTFKMQKMSNAHPLLDKLSHHSS